MIKSIQLQFGAVADGELTHIDTTPITLFVGPNNSGKSKFLRELNWFFTKGSKRKTDSILESLVLSNIPANTLEDTVEDVSLEPGPNQAVQINSRLVKTANGQTSLQEEHLKKILSDPNSNQSLFCPIYFSQNTVFLDGKSRMELVKEQNATDLQKRPLNVLDRLFRDDSKRRDVRRIVLDAFNLHFVVDPTNLGKFRVRFSPSAPESDSQERGIDDEAIRFHANALPVNEASDGVRAFTGIVMQMIAGDPKVVLVDEPEAFLHPALSYKLGKEIASIASDEGKSVFIATHSADFVMGVVQSGVPVNIVRLTYREGTPTARILTSEKLLQLMRNPLLRSVGVLNGLFYEGVVVTEGDTDRAFYQEINERLLASSEKRGFANCLFLNAQNKQTIQQIVAPLRGLGIPAAAIVDIDIIKDSGPPWSNFLKCGCVPSTSHKGLGQTRSDLLKKCEQSGKNMKRDGGISILDEEDSEAAEDFLAQLEQYGLFVVSGGELESWLKSLEVEGHGPR